MKTNVVIEPTKENGLAKPSIADCLQIRPIDYYHRLKRIRGQLNKDDIQRIDRALKIIFALS
ncbi:MAG: type II toxin-antitoxin system PemK/MazF family toxin [Chloroflexi bacterium]|nr:type II toxin-antitoxin system PemK/MazF family toxin [Chloroflexota bacterium]